MLRKRGNRQAHKQCLSGQLVLTSIYSSIDEDKIHDSPSLKLSQVRLKNFSLQ